MADQIQSLEDFCREIEAWRKQVGLTEVDDREMQNSGKRRTPEKRELLRRTAERCRSAGVEPFPVNY
jgi:hypothetical protein